MAKVRSKITRNEPESFASVTEKVGSSDTAPRLSLQLTDQGDRVDWERVRPRTVAQLRQVLADPDLPAKLGVAAPDLGSAPAGDVIDPNVVNMLYYALGSIGVGWAKAAGYPADQAATMQFTDDEKLALVGPTGKVLARYAGAMGRWQDEIMLTFLFTTIVTGKVSQLKKPATVTQIRAVPAVQDSGTGGTETENPLTS